MRLPIKWYVTAFADDPGESEECRLVELGISHAVWKSAADDVEILWNEQDGFSYRVTYAGHEKIVRLYNKDDEYRPKSGFGYVCTPIYEEP